MSRPKKFVKSGERRDREDDLCSYVELVVALKKTESTLSFAEWKRVLSPLTIRQRRSVILRFLLGLSLEECGERMGVTWQAVHASLEGAVKKLRDGGNLELLAA